MLVTGSYLGSLSHTLTALDVLARRGLAVKSLVVNETPGSPVTMQDTADTLASFAAARSLSVVPRGPGDAAKIFAELAGLLEV